MSSGIKIIGVLLLSFLSFDLFSQALSSIEGKVIDAKTKEPLPFASVYLAKTSIGVASRADGTFLLDNIPEGKYDLTVSMLGYKTVSKSILFTGSPMTGLLIGLESRAKELEAVTILSSKIKRSKSAFSAFKKFFLGETRNAFRCRILNPDDIFAYRENGKLLALSTKPIEIENQALGYKIVYELKEFEVDYLRSRIITSGIPRFEELTPKNERQKAKWILERDRAYYGSVEHFLKSLLYQNLTENFFKIKNNSGDQLKESDLIQKNIINYKGVVLVTYTNEQNELQSGRFISWEQNSKIEFNGKPVIVYDNGNYEEFRSLFLDGYFGWLSHIGDLIPFGYQPAHDIKLIR